MYAQFGVLINRIVKGIQDPEDYICVGTLMNALVDLGDLTESIWVVLMDALFVKKYDE